MWAFKLAKKETRTIVPSYRNFMEENQDSLKLWFEEMREVPDERSSFLVRLIKFLTHIAILFIMLYVLINPKDSYYQKECAKRLTCYNSCNDDYFPDLSC
jgi:hypothetical protein